MLTGQFSNKPTRD